ncbi:response regulator transcription factor [Legionella cardiaca]|uniref:LuxR C-terminal-related transcriptional regulator n=1 Tax=Legionella cardiaca TaxID=1071983 RepID=A0ABY8AS58_9GAMM|nr:LuxR C-terminal-related transcriptional regulator [Legionella cardiaca]WED43517.1 LuxR C-terminal-related transcriptional regulator [Legionella cardiaca]
MQALIVWGNLPFCILAGITQPNDLQGLTDYDLPWCRKQSNQYRADDKKIIETKIPRLNYLEQQTRADNKTYTNVVSKIYYVDEKQNFEGIICQFTACQTLNTHPNDLPIFSKSCSTANGKEVKFNRLSKRQLDCLRHYAEGYTSRKIGDILDLSPRTVEHYLEAVKNKLNCSTRAELVKKALQMNLLS